jgi:molybdopterin-containing oxidoreductase family iron-sulfur binding subunit
MSNPSYLRKGNDDDVATLVSDMNAGNIDALITYNVNPSYTLVNADEFNQGLTKVGLKVSTSLYIDETSSKMDYVCPDNHNLESWGDTNPSNGIYTLMQPTINPLFNGRQFQDSLLTWSDSSEKYYDYLKNSYSNWNTKLHDGHFNGDRTEYSLVFQLEYEFFK